VKSFLSHIIALSLFCESLLDVRRVDSILSHRDPVKVMSREEEIRAIERGEIEFRQNCKVSQLSKKMRKKLGVYK
jgi:hypothetical protein